jgi:hypothetical protein
MGKVSSVQGTLSRSRPVSRRSNLIGIAERTDDVGDGRRAHLLNDGERRVKGTMLDRTQLPPEGQLDHSGKQP